MNPPRNTEGTEECPECGEFVRSSEMDRDDVAGFDSCKECTRAMEEEMSQMPFLQEDYDESSDVPDGSDSDIDTDLSDPSDSES